LKKRGVAILLKDEVYEEQRYLYIAQFEKTWERQPTDAELRFIRSGEAECLVKLKRSLADGLDVICFVDGQEGNATGKGWTTVDLRDVSISARYGVAVLSRWTGVSVKPVIFSLVQDAIQLHSLEDFQPVSGSHYQSLMQYCYDLLQGLKAEEMVQWEFALSFFDAVVMPHQASRSGVMKASPWWLPIRASERHLLIDVRSGKTVVVSEDEHLYLCDLIKTLIVKFA